MIRAGAFKGYQRVVTARSVKYINCNAPCLKVLPCRDYRFLPEDTLSVGAPERPTLTDQQREQIAGFQTPPHCRSLAEGFEPTAPQRVYTPSIRSLTDVVWDRWMGVPTPPLPPRRSPTPVQQHGTVIEEESDAESVHREDGWQEALETNERAVRWERMPAPKFKYYFKGNISKQRINSLPEVTQEKQPLFVKETAWPKPMKNTYPTGNDLWGNRKWLMEHMETDADLLAYLRLEAAFVPRTPGLLLQLKVKGQRFMNQLDCSLYTREQVADMIIRAAGAAMLIGKEEEKVRALMQIKSEAKMRAHHNEFFRNGNLNTGSLDCPAYTPKKQCAPIALATKALAKAMPF
ncbi:MAG: hypothetical protein SToV3_gp1 [Sanya tombus-like virus 3]|nr:MAG: hypothetical protein SToV3_gp1 [Sanya tombus-like virus 3]